MKSDACLPIEEVKLKDWATNVEIILNQVKWTPKIENSAQTTSAGERKYIDVSAPAGRETTLSLKKIGADLDKTTTLYADRVNHVLRTVRKGLMIGQHMADQYGKNSGLTEMALINEANQKTKNTWTPEQTVEFQQKWQTATAAGLFSAATYIVWDLSQFDTELVQDVKIDFRGVPEVHLANIVKGMNCMAFYYAAYLNLTDVVKTDLDFVKMTLLYFEGMVNELKLRAGSLKYTEPFSGQSYKLEGTEFTIRGFEFEREHKVESMEFNRKLFTDIVGNRDAKHKARRAVERTLCFDFPTKKNVFLELGGLPARRLGYGPPGTGKSLLIAAIATMFKDRCEQIGIPFLFWPFPDTPISEFQGKSAQKIVEWCQPFTEPTKIIYAPIDDAENVLEERTRQGVSEGVRGVIGVLLRYWEGAYSPDFGNSLTDILTNIPDQVDRAVMSRVIDRFLIAGAETKEDIMAQNKLWYEKYETILPGFVSMKDPRDGYDYFEGQGEIKNLGAIYKDITEPKNETLREIFHKVRKQYEINEHEFFGVWGAAVKATFPGFTSRDIRNIQENISARIMDFDLPTDWFEHPDMFFRKDYDSKKAMVIEIMKANMKGLSFADIRLQESIIYMDNMVGMANQEEERAIESYVQDLIRRQKAETRFCTLGAK